MRKVGRGSRQDKVKHTAQAPTLKHLEQFILAFQQTYNVDLSRVLSSLHDLTQPDSVPASVFCEELSSFEAVVTYLKENKQLTFHQIAQLLSRDDRTIWTTYQKARAKHAAPLTVDSSAPVFPASILQNRSLSVLENIVSYFKDQGLSLRQIGLILKRDERNVWTVHSRAKKKWQRK